MQEYRPDRHPFRTLAVLLAFGVTFFVGLLFVILTLVSSANIRLDSSVSNFYWIMAGCGALFGFERWLSHEQGAVNPFHDR